MSSNEIELEPTEEEMSSVSSTMFFLKITGIVTLVLAGIILVSSPSLYMGISKDSPKYWETEARNLVQKKDYEKAIEAYQKVLNFEPDRKDIFVRADHHIKSLKQLIARQKRAAKAVEEEEKEAQEDEGKTKGKGKTEGEGKTEEEGEGKPKEGTDDSEKTTPESPGEKEGSTDEPEKAKEKDEKPDSKTDTEYPSPDDAGFD